VKALKQVVGKPGIYTQSAQGKPTKHLKPVKALKRRGGLSLSSLDQPTKHLKPVKALKQ
jgi:hypothetical protein